MKNLDWTTIGITAGVCLVAVLIGNAFSDHVVNPQLAKMSKPASKTAGK